MEFKKALPHLDQYQKTGTGCPPSFGRYALTTGYLSFANDRELEMQAWGRILGKSPVLGFEVTF